MGHVCRTCSRVNPPDAMFCYYDGVALSTHHQGGPVAAGAKLFPTPFVFPSGRQCRNFDELVRHADADWNAAQDLLNQGFFESFLGGLGRADLAMAARQSAKEIDRERGLDQFLAKLPVSNRDAAKLIVQPLEINLGLLSGERHFVLQLENGGGGLLTGSIAGDETSWLAFGDAPGTSQKLFQCRFDTEIAVHVVGKNLRASNKPSEGRILIEANGGTALIMVRVEKPVQPFPEGVLAGAKLPREIASRAKHHPKEAARLFEKGAVQAWYESNGWTYPVQGPSSSGLGAIQQFYEALGLVQPPKVTISHEKIQFQGKVGRFVEQVVQVQTVEKRPVYAHGTTNTPWLQIGRPILEGRTASIPIRVPSIPSMPGECLKGTVQVASNGNQRFTIEVELKVSASAVRPVVATAPMIDISDALSGKQLGVLSSATPLELENGREFSSSRSAPVTPSPAPVVVDTLEVLPPAAPNLSVFADLTATSKPTPSRRSERSEAPTASPLLPFIAPILPILFLGASMFVVLLHDLLVRSVGSDSRTPGVVDATPLIALRFHDGPKLFRDGKPRMPDPTMRFGLLMRREGTGKERFLGLTEEDFKALQTNQPADLQHFKRLTFDDWGRSNNTCLKIDGEEFLFGDTTGQWLAREESLGEGKQGFRSIWQLERTKIAVTQRVEVVPGEQSGRYDTCLIRYSIDNKDVRSHSVGLRFLLDTYIGDNDGVPFTIPGDAGLCDTMKIFNSSDQVPDYIEALENPDLRHPGTVARLQFRVGSKLESPTRVLLGGWPHAGLKVKEANRYRTANNENTLWDVPAVSMQYLNQQDDVFVKDEKGNKIKPAKDSAVTLYWDPQLLTPGKTREVGFTYGLGNVSSGEGEGRLLLTVGGRLVRDGDFTLTALVASPKQGEKLTLVLPSDLKLVGGSETQTVPPVPPGAARETSTVTWKLRAVRDKEYTLQVKSSNGQTQSQSVTIRSTGVFD